MHRLNRFAGVLAAVCALLFAGLSAWAAEQAPKVVARIKVDRPLRDPSVCRGPGDVYYLTGSVCTVGEPQENAFWENAFWENDGVYMWKSKDLETWEPMGCVMVLKDQPYELYGPYRWLHKVQVLPDRYGEKRLYGVDAPEVHYARDTFWLTISMVRQGTAVMRSTSGKAEGPYELVDLLSTRGEDPSMCAAGEDIWWTFGEGYVTKLVTTKPGKHTPRGRKETMALQPRPQLVRPQAGEDGVPLCVGERGAFLVEADGKFHLLATEQVIGPDNKVRWDTFVATADKPLGPYGKRRLLIPGGGPATVFRHADGRLLAACALGVVEMDLH
jgi:hypothetical protein